MSNAGAEGGQSPDSPGEIKQKAHWSDKVLGSGCLLMVLFFIMIIIIVVVTWGKMLFFSY